MFYYLEPYFIFLGVFGLRVAADPGGAISSKRTVIFIIPTCT
jgi:hypothetical protein